MSAKKAYSRYSVFYETTIWDCGKITTKKEEFLGTTIAVSERKAISNISYRMHLPVMDGGGDGNGYERSSLMKARKIGNVK